ncbi:uncharacterized membrane protein YhaH (DUF805 family) [Weissella uvarum]|uniref:DUF805 domain-containing protein n=1 Tax=Weissella uvarum TaxID=1479233 RepID=UPI00196130A7|nr:DUF805 domain-containing protein [Weissella uvarum]MBM7617612.1 uncharacterized membrane protein YhaH (DUF805 family) [Weissella uvarum]MCM0595962.1 DUF805 domain-containing protein [Weissella uvarum]
MKFLNAVLDYWKQMFDYRSKQGRLSFFVGFTVNALLVGVAYYAISYILGFMGGYYDADEGSIDVMIMAITWVMIIAYTVAYISSLNRRLRDAGFNPWWTLGDFVPLVQIAVFIFTFFPTKKGS